MRFPHEITKGMSALNSGLFISKCCPMKVVEHEEDAKV